MSKSVKFTPTLHLANDLSVYGSVQDVIAGRSAEVLPRLNATDYRYGFEVASPIDKDSIGEAVLVNGYCFSASTLEGDNGKTLSGQTFVSNGVFLVPDSAKPTHTFSSNMPVNMDDFVAQALQQAQAPCLYVANVVFQTLSATYIARAPIYNENIFEHKDVYYCHAPKLYHNIHAWIIGVVTDYHNPELENTNQSLEVVLYRNPFEHSSALSNHTHGITLHHPVQVTDIHPNVVENVLHIFNKDTVMSSITDGELYAIKSVHSV